jgi:hypothetical protein
MPMMTIFEPLFILLFLAAAVTLLMAGVAALRGQRPRALRILRRLAIGAGAYFAIVLLVAFFSEPPVRHVGELICFDDWCITVAEAKPTRTGSTQSWHVTLRVSSRAKRIEQRENNAAVFLTDSRGGIYRPDPASATVPLDSRVGPGESVDASRTFTLPPDATDVRLVFTHEGGFPIGALIIGENQLFHHATVVELGRDPAAP